MLMTKIYSKTYYHFKSEYKVTFFFSNMQVFHSKSAINVHFATKNHVSYWKSYGIWNQCGTCESQQSSTGVAPETSISAGQ